MSDNRRSKEVRTINPIHRLAIAQDRCRRGEWIEVGVRQRDMITLDHRGLELHVAALPGEETQHRHLVVLMRRDVQTGAIRAIRHEPLVDLGCGEGDRDARLARERGDQQSEQAV